MSNLKINYSKSEALNISLPNNILKITKENSPFKWDPWELKYLGAWLTPHLTSIYDQNFPLLIKVIERDLKNWYSGYFSWFGRAAIIKMSVLPKLLYLLLTLAIKIPQHFFKALHSILLKFLRNHNKSRIKFSLLK